MKLYLIIFNFFLFTNGHTATVQIGECRAKNQISDAATKLDIPNCGLAQGLARNSDVQNYHRNKIYDKLSTKLAIQIEQSMEETTLLDQYYSANNTDLLPSGESSVKKNCQLDTIGEIENCHGKMNLNNPTYKLKLDLLKSKIKKNLAPTCSQENLSLQEMLKAKVIQIMGVQLKSNSQCADKKKSCPIQGNSGAYTISAQLDNNSAKNFIDIIQDSKSNPIDVKKSIDHFFMVYPQFKIIQNSKGNLKDIFINYLKSYKQDKGTAKEFINKFIFNNQGNQRQLSDTLGTQCEDLNNNLTTFLCGKDLEGDQLASLDSPTSINLFGLNPNLSDDDIFEDAPGDGETFYTAFGFQCLAKSEKAKGNKLNRNNSVDSWFKDFTKNTRPQSNSNNDVQSYNNQFCSIYNCEAETVQSSNFCKNGGPLSSDGLKSIFDCDHKACSNEILKYISYMEGLKKIDQVQSAISLNGKQSDGSSSTDSETSKGSSNNPKPRYSAFLENYLGAKGTLIAEGKPTTLAAIAEKTQEISTRKSGSPTSTSEAKLSEAKPFIVSKNVNPPMPENSLNKIEPSKFEQMTKNEVAAIPSVKHSTSPTSSKKLAEKDSSQNYNSQNNGERDTEIKKMRSELESITSSIKSNPPRTIVDSNANFIPANLGGFNKSDISKGINSADKIRNEQYQQSLNAQEARLNNWQEKLAERESKDYQQERDDRSPASTNEANNAKTHSENSDGSSKTNNSQVQLSSSSISSSSADKGVQTKTNAATTNSGSNDSPIANISSEELAHLNIESLKKLKINSNNAFIIKISHKQNYYNVTVTKLSYKGKEILVPLLNESNSSIAKIILESPLFSDYKKLQLDRQKERQDFAQN